MCIMEVREGQHHSTIAQAQAHNTNTVISDCAMFARMLDARGRHEEANEVLGIQRQLETSYESFLDLYTSFLTGEIMSELAGFSHSHGEDMEAHEHHFDGVPLSAEEVFQAIKQTVRRDENRARVFETRR